jgi:hypothetical protein
MTARDLLPCKDDAKVLGFCRGICPDASPFYVPLRPEPGFSPLQCFPNVAKKVEMSGGKLVYGWEISQIPKVHLEAVFHAIWQAPTGKYFDVTPGLPEENGRARILFLPDAHRTYIGQEVPRKRFLIGADNKLVQQYWSLADEAMALRESVACGGMREDDPAVRAHLTSLGEQMRTVRERIQKA